MLIETGLLMQYQFFNTKNDGITRIVLLFSGIIWFGLLNAQTGTTSYRVVFYNVENLFDTRKDSVTDDGDFTPRGRLYWNRERYNRKLLHISEALVGVGDGECPAFIGLAEVENRAVLEDLTRKSILAIGEWGIVHADSPDPRGIDVALLYRKSCFEVLAEEFIPVMLGKNRGRDILYCKGVLQQADTLHFFVCHFPSMRGGERQTEWKRICAAEALRNKVDSIQEKCLSASILIMGDMNGKAKTKAQKKLGAVSSESGKIKADGLYNTGYYLLGKNRGSYRYQGVWQTIDHIIVSGALLNGKQSLQAGKRMSVFSPDYLLEGLKTHYGTRPLPTYRGPQYIGGYSDHLPVYIDLTLTL